ncbi:hypothetical protein [Embleya sp. NPDC001921]
MRTTSTAPDARAVGRLIARPHPDGGVGVEAGDLDELLTVLGIVARYGGTVRLTTTDPGLPRMAPIAESVYVVHFDLRAELVEHDRAREITALDRLVDTDPTGRPNRQQGRCNTPQVGGPQLAGRAKRLRICHDSETESACHRRGRAKKPPARDRPVPRALRLHSTDAKLPPVPGRQAGRRCSGRL